MIVKALGRLAWMLGVSLEVLLVGIVFVLLLDFLGRVLDE